MAAISSAGTFISNLWSTLIHGVGNIINNVINAFEELPGNIVNIGQNIVEGLWNGISGAWDWIVNKVSSFSQGILDGMKHALGIHSPSTLFRDMIGKNIVLGVSVGIDKNSNAVLDSIDNMKSNLVDKLKNSDINSIYKKMQSAVSLSTGDLSSKISTSASVSKVLNANIALGASDIYMDSTKVGRAVTPIISKTIREAGAY